MKIQEKEFLTLYGQGLNDREISLHFNCTTTLVNYYRNSKKLPPNKVIINITQEQLSVMVGSLLGDMNLYKPQRSPKNVNSYAGGFTHSIHQKDYFMFKYNILNNLMGVVYYPINKRSGKEYLHISSYFLQGTHLKPLYDAFYNPKKTLPDKEFIYANFNEMSLAILFGDDGCLVKGKFYALATMGFEDSEILFIQDLLFSKFNIKSKVMKSRGLYIGIESSHIISNAIKKHLENTLDYKTIKCSV